MTEHPSRQRPIGWVTRPKIALCSQQFTLFCKECNSVSFLDLFNGDVVEFEDPCLSGLDFAAWRDLCACQFTNPADFVTPIAHRGSPCGEIPARQAGPTESSCGRLADPRNCS